MMKDNKKSRWDDLESWLKSDQTHLSRNEPDPVEKPAEIIDPDGLPRELSVPASSLEPMGFLMQFREGVRQNEMIAEALKAQREAQLTVLKYLLQQAVAAKNAQTNLIARRYLMELDDLFLQAQQQFELRHLEQKVELITDVTDRIVTWIDSVRSRDWPESLINRTIDQFLALREQVVNQFLHELGS